jgi:hypothetical protein
MKNFKELGVQAITKSFKGDKIKIERILNREIIVHDFRVAPSKYEGSRLDLQIEINGNYHVVFTGSQVLKDTIEKVSKEDFPFRTTITKHNEHFEFT